MHINLCCVYKFCFCLFLVDYYQPLNSFMNRIENDHLDQTPVLYFFNFLFFIL